MLAITTLGAPTALANPSLDSQINQVNNDIKNQQGAANQLHGQADTLAGKVASLNSQISTISAQISQNRAKAARLNRQIADAQAELAVKKQILDESVRQIYQQSSVTPLEMLASSKNFSDYVDKQQYTDRIKDHIQEAAAAVQKLKDGLVKEQNELNGILATQSTQQAALDSARSEQAGLLQQTQGQESAYQQLVASNKQKLQGLYAERAAFDASHGVSITTGGDGDYPWANEDVNGVDPYGYYYRQCVSYAAWYRLNKGGGVARPIHWGNAGEWDSHYPYDGVASPGSIAVFDPGVQGAGSVGHVGIVLSSSGGTMTMAEYNWRPYTYSVRSGVGTAGVKFIH